MKRIALFLVALTGAASPLITAQQPSAVVSGELRQWHKITLTLDGPQADQTSNSPNPFLDYRMTVTFVHESGIPAYSVPGYFAADGSAANSSASSGNKWRAHFSPEKVGRWEWHVSFVSGKNVAVDAAAAATGQSVLPIEGLHGTIQVAASNKTGVDFRARGRLEYVGQRYLRFAGSGEYFLKVGADAPETLLGYADFDATRTMKTKSSGRAWVGENGLHEYGPHIKDWKTGDPTWKDGKGKGLIGAVNYLSSKGARSISFLTYNAGGDGDNVWPFVDRDDKFHYHTAKLDQWQIVFDHAQQKGLYLHFKLQETENDDNQRGEGAGRGGRGARGGVDAPTGPPVVRESLDGGNLGPERKLYIREMIARFGYSLALNWNLGEENSQTSEQQRAMADFIRSTDPYRHHIVVHTFPNATERVYLPLLADQSALTGASLQVMYNGVHAETLKWVIASEKAGRSWVVANDEQGPAGWGVPADPGFRGWTGANPQGNATPATLHDIRKYSLWGNLMAGGTGVEYYFGYAPPENDLDLEDFRSRDKTWDYGRIALDFFRTNQIPFWEMKNCDELVGNSQHDNSSYCFAKEGELYLVYLPSVGQTNLELRGTAGQFNVRWFDPRSGGALRAGSVAAVKGGSTVNLGAPPAEPGEDWVVVVRRN